MRLDLSDANVDTGASAGIVESGDGLIPSFLRLPLDKKLGVHSKLRTSLTGCGLSRDLRKECRVVSLVDFWVVWVENRVRFGRDCI